MRTMYVWHVRTVTWEDQHPYKRNFQFIAGRVEEAIAQVRSLSPEFEDARIESVRMVKKYFGGVEA